jgi:VanZ family protein
MEWFGFDKVVHIGMFAAWAVAVRYDLSPEQYPFLYVFLTGLFFSLVTEVLQILIEGRNFDVYDILADAIGVLAGLLISKKLLRLIKR